LNEIFMKQKYIMAIDQGTTSTKILLFDKSGNTYAREQKEHQQIYPEKGWVEHDPLEIWDNTIQLYNQILKNKQISAENIDAIGITNQRETLVVWDKHTGKPVYNAIVWQDTRTQSLCDNIKNTNSEQVITEKTGLPVSTYFSATKLIWILKNVLKKNQENLLAGTIDSWLIWNFTGGANTGIHVTDVTNASRTMLFNINTLKWDTELLSQFDIRQSLLPKVIPSVNKTNLLMTDKKITGNSIPLTGILGDQQAALFGHRCFQSGEMKITYGTGCFLLLNTGDKIVSSRNGLLSTIAYQKEGENPVYALEGSVAITGSLVQWLRDNLGIIDNSAQIEQLANQVDDNGGVYFVPAFSGLFAPYWDSTARGTILGMTHHSNKSHIARAVLEATAYQVKDIIGAIRKDIPSKLSPIIKVDGGMTANNLLMQFQADILNNALITAQTPEVTALGVAYAAGLGSGFWLNCSDLARENSSSFFWKPDMKKESRILLYKHWKKAVSKARNWI